MTLTKLTEVLNYTMFSVADQPITFGGILFIPILIISALLVTKWLVSNVTNKLKSKHTDPNIIHLLRRVVYIISLVLIVMTTLDILHVPITAFAFLSGAIAIGFGFGAQNIINNFISGWILIWEKPIRIGDFLEVEDSQGTVEEINTRSTRLKRIDGVHMLIPNSKLLENTVVNWTLVDNLIRTSVKIGVAYGSPAKQVAQLIMQAATEQKEILTEPKPLVTFEDFGDNALMFEVHFWVDSNVEGGLRVTRSNVRFRLDELFNEHNIVIAFPQMDVHIDGALALTKKRANN